MAMKSVVLEGDGGAILYVAIGAVLVCTFEQAEMPCRKPGRETNVYLSVTLSPGRPYGLMGKSTRHELSSSVDNSNILGLLANITWRFSVGKENQ